MRRLTGKRFILGLMAVILCVTACVPAFASTGDRILMHQSTVDGYGLKYVESVLPCGNGLYMIVREDHVTTIERYADIHGEPEKFELESKNLDVAEDEEDVTTNTYVSDWFVRGEELYALSDSVTMSGDESKTELSVQHAKLENGQVILEESDLPELDLSSLIVEDDDYAYTKGIDKLFTMEDKLILTAYGDAGKELLVIDLQDGTCTEMELGDDFNEITPGPEGSVLITRYEWDDDSNITIKVNRLDLADQSETELTMFTGMSFPRISPTYSAEKDTLYYFKDGELWAVPQFDMTRTEAVNDCPDNGYGMFLLPNGYVVIWTSDTVMAKNTDPAQRGSVTLRVTDNSWSSATNEAVYTMNDTRGDISVVLKSDWRRKSEILQEMLNRDSSTDVYLLEYDSNEFSAMRSRDYLPDLSSNEKIAASTNRLYPYLQEAVKQNGKIIGVPVSFGGETLGIHMDMWKGIGGTEEELPKTWNQFFDWLETLPERLEGTEVFVAPMSDRVCFRADILELLLNQYEIRMEKKGETDYAFANPELCELVRRLNNLDYDALQIAEARDEEEEEDEEYLYDGYDREPLLDTYTSSVVNGDADYVPLALSFSEDEEPVLPVRICIAFMNPFTEHPQEAMEFLACVAENIDAYAASAAFTDKTEPKRSPYYEGDIKNYQETLDALKKQLSEAEEDERASLEERIKDTEESIELNERYSWLISPEQMERYQKWQNYFKVRGYSFINELFGNSSNEEEEEDDYEKLFYSKESASMSPEELLGMLDQKVRMIRMERN